MNQAEQKILMDKLRLLETSVSALRRTVTRTETRVVTGFNKLGVDPCSYEAPDGLSFDTSTSTVYIRGGGTAVADLLAFITTLDVPASNLRIKAVRASTVRDEHD